MSFNQLEEGTRLAHPLPQGVRFRIRRGGAHVLDRIIRGYEISKGQYVVVEPEEIESLQPKAGHTIDIDQFIDLDQIDPVYFEQPYYPAARREGHQGLQAARRRDDHRAQGRGSARS